MDEEEIVETKKRHPDSEPELETCSQKDRQVEKVVGSLIWVFQNWRGRFPFHWEVPKQTHVNFAISGL